MLGPVFVLQTAVAAGALLMIVVRPVPECFLWGAAAGAFNCVLDAVRGDWQGSAVNAALVLWFCFLYWHIRNRRKRKKPLRELGAKSRAWIAALVRTVRERAVPRPVPVPA